MIEILALDIDGVLTDGKVTIDENNVESKTIFYRDVDAIYEAHRAGLTLVFVTGEDSPWVGMITRKLEIKHVYRGAKDKLKALEALSRDLNVEIARVCYVGDSTRDIPAIKAAGIGYAPADAAESAREAADVVLKSCGGNGAVSEAIGLILKLREVHTTTR